MTLPTEPDSEPGKNAAVLAQRALEEVLFGIPHIPFEMDRTGIGERLHRAMQCCYAVLDSNVLAPVHYEGLTEALALALEARGLLARGGERAESAALGRALDGLDLGASALRLGAAAVADIQLARRLELGGQLQARELPKERPFRVSRGTPSLHAFARRPLVPELSLDALAPEAPESAPPKRPQAPRSLDALRAFAASASPDELEKRMAGEAQEPEAEPFAEPIFLHEPPIEEVETLRRLGRDCLEDIAIHFDLRKPNAIESWLDQAPFEQRLLDNLDCFASVGGAALPMVSLYFAEAKAPDPGRAFAVALTLGSIEGRDTIDAAIATLKQAAPETYAGWLEGFALAPSPAIDPALVELAEGPRAALAVLALEVLSRRGTAPFALVSRLATEARDERAEAAVRALAHAGSHEAACGLLEELLGQTESETLFVAAAEAAMARGHGAARSLLRQALSGAAAPARTDAAAWLLCLGGHESDLPMLLGYAAASRSPRLVRGLGRFGHVGSLDFLVGLLRSGDEALCDAAAEALERITAAGQRETVEEPWEVELPPDADLTDVPPIPTRRIEKVVTDPERWEAWLRANVRRFDPALRYRGGAPFSALAIVDELESRATPPPRRYEAAEELRVATGLLVPFAADDWVARQTDQLAEVRTRVRREGLAVGGWGFGAVRRESAAPPRLVPAKPPVGSRTLAFSLPAAPAALPFVKTPEGPFVPEPEATTAVEASPIPRRPALPFVGATRAPEPTAAGPVGGLPFVPAAAAAPARSAELTLEQYAWLTARLQAEPAKLGEVLTQLGIASEDEWTLLAIAWERRLASDPSSRARWAELVRHYRGRAG